MLFSVCRYCPSLLINKRLWASRLVQQQSMTEKSGFDALMHQVCVDWGLCGSVIEGKYVHVTDLIPQSGMVTASQFAEWVLMADGESDAPPRFKEKWLARLRDAFILHMKDDQVDVQRLKWHAP